MTHEQKKYIEMQNSKQIVPGDFVKVLRTAKGGERGWNDCWVSRMTLCVGKTLEVESVGSRGIALYVDERNSLNFPFFVLKKTKKPL